MRAVWQQTSASEAAAEPQALAAALFTRAQQIHDDDVERCLRIGAHGAGLLKPGDTILTHCNAGALATAGYGTALGVVRAAFARHEGIDVLVDETRPWLQGARLTAWELQVEGIPYRLITDSMAGHFIARAAVQASSWAPTASRPTATRPTRSAPTRSPCWPRSTVYRSTWRRRSRPSTAAT